MNTIHRIHSSGESARLGLLNILNGLFASHSITCRISIISKFTSCLHPKQLGEISHIFHFVRKTHTSCYEFNEKITFSSPFSKKSEFLLRCH